MEESWLRLPLADLLDELQIAQIRLETLDPDDDDYESDKMALENSIRYLEYSISQQRPQMGGSDSTSFGPDSEQGYSNFPSTKSSSNLSFGSTGSPRPLSQPRGSSSSLYNLNPPTNGYAHSTLLPSRKRPRENYDLGSDLQQAVKSRRATPSPSASIASSPTMASSEDFEDDDTMRTLFGSNIGEEYRGLRKETRRAERELNLRREQERRDEELARSLQAELNHRPGSQSMPSMHRQTSQTVLDRTTGGIRTMPPPPAPPKPWMSKPSPFSTPSSQPSSSRNHVPGGWPVKNEFDTYRKSNMNNVFNIDSDDDDDDLEEISSDQFRPNPARAPSKLNAYRVTLPDPRSLYQAKPMGGYQPPSWAGTGGTSVYSSSSNPAYDLVDRHINSFGSPVSGFALPTPGREMSNPYAIDLTIPGAYSSNSYDDAASGNTEEEIKNLLENIRPDEEFAGDREGDPEAMKYPLMPHQKLGVAWMKSMEEGSNKGGILADDMGLGKTIQALALIVARPSEDPQRKTTLIVAPVALMQQWKREIEKKIKSSHRLSVLLLHGSDRNTPWKDIKHFDIVLTTYGTLASEIKRKQQWDGKLKSNPNIKPSSKEDILPILGDDCAWYRVILDESQHIKNKSTRAALGAWHIRSTYRWCMSGTPMMNSVLELYSLIHFLRIRPYNSAENFNRDFTRPLSNKKAEWQKERAMQQLQALLKAILLRRTKKSQIDGKPILQLPEKICEQTHAVFSDDERAFYSALEGKAQLTFNKYVNAGSIGRNYSNILVLLLRLRQACCHPHLIKDFAYEVGANGDVDLKANAAAFGPDVIARLREMEAFDCPICIDACENPQIFFPCGHAACLDCFSRMTDPSQGLAQGSEGGIEIKCPNCRAVIDPRKVTDFMTFKEVHFAPPPEPEPTETANDEENATNASEAEDDSESDSDEEDEDEDKIEDDDSIKDFIVNDDNQDALKKEENSDDEDDDDLSTSKKGKTAQSKMFQSFQLSSMTKDSDTESQADTEDKKVDKKAKDKAKDKRRKKPKKSKKKKGKAIERDKLEKTQLTLAQLRKEGLKNKSAKRKYLERLEENWVTSAKVDKAMEILEQVHGRGQGEKTIVFSAFTSLLDLLEVPVSRQSWNYRRYDGSMTPNERNSAVIDFTDKASCTIMLVSLKAGNSGLNLTAANNVIIFDPFWNPYIEEQAIDRAYRIGQMREVHVHRVIVPDTVEDRILALQEKKRELIENALDENAGRSVARLGERELAYLFGVRRGAA